MHSWPRHPGDTLSSLEVAKRPAFAYDSFAPLHNQPSLAHVLLSPQGRDGPTSHSAAALPNWRNLKLAPTLPSVKLSPNDTC